MNDVNMMLIFAAAAALGVKHIGIKMGKIVQLCDMPNVSFLFTVQ